MSTATVSSRHTDKDSKVEGTYNPNLILDTRVYDVMFLDGSTQVYAVNVIAESMYTQLDSEEYMTHIIQEITHHQKDALAITIDDKYVTSKNGDYSIRKTTKG